MKPTRLIMAVMAITACQKAETPEQAAARMEQESAAARTAIEAQNARYGAFMAAGQSDSVASLHTEDSEILPPHERAVSGRANIATYMAGGLAQGTFALTLTSQSVMADGADAFERGTYTFSFTPGPSAPKEMTAMADTGKYIAHWRKQDGQWLIAHDIWNSDLPLPQP